MPFQGLSSGDQEALVKSWQSDVQSAIRSIPNIRWVLSTKKCHGLTPSQRDGLVAKLTELTDALKSVDSFTKGTTCRCVPVCACTCN